MGWPAAMGWLAAVGWLAGGWLAGWLWRPAGRLAGWLHVGLASRAKNCGQICGREQFRLLGSNRVEFSFDFLSGGTQM